MIRSSRRTEMPVTLRILIALVLSMLVGALMASAPVPAEAVGARRSVQVIAEAADGDMVAVAQAVEAAGGLHLTDLSLIESVVASVPLEELPDLQDHPAIARLTVDGRISLLSDDDAGWSNAASLSNYSPQSYGGSMYWVAQEITGAGEYWNDGHIGSGVGVALIDSGVVGVDGLTYSGKVVNGPDISLESQAADRHYLDTMGHGTHMAGIIAGRDDAATVVQKGDTANFLGMAPGAHIVSVKVADYEGSTDVSQVIAAIDWVVQHRDDPGLNIRVLNLSFGTDGVQSRLLDPLAFAVERAWANGIVVVVAAGNDGRDVPLRNPALDPFVISVGATDSQMTYSASDDLIPSFSSCGTYRRHVDVVAPGQSIVSLRNPGSVADTEHPEARVGQRFFLGSGTSQAAAVVSGAAALIIDQRPGISPDEVKALLMDTAQPVPSATALCQGAGLIDLKVARDTATPSATQRYWPSTGSGSLDAARGTHRLVAPAPPSIDAASGSNTTDAAGDSGYVVLRGEIDIFGMPFDSTAHAIESWLGIAWQGGVWNGSSWSGSSWSGSSWSGSSWSGSSWSGSSWSGSSWSGSSWSGNSWNGSSWSGSSWSGSSWSGSSWSGSSWSGSSWSSPISLVLAQRIR